ncbi:MAG: hypothetical protein Q8Q85_00030 [Gemmatimonadales bacterium]|nr:hypothetical protein [Gemmatimonadales bacterium]
MTLPRKDTHHLFRLWLHKSTWEKLRIIAHAETDRRREYISASDLARVALKDWIEGYVSAERLGAMRPPAGDEAEQR